MGVELQGSLTDLEGRGRMVRRVDASSGDRPVFAPLVTNGTPDPLAITVNAGTINALACDCRVNPGANRARIGYYPLFLNSSVEARVSGGGAATFREIASHVDRTSGSVGLRFEPRDFPR
jgi:hypothetical protein